MEICSLQQLVGETHRDWSCWFGGCGCSDTRLAAGCRSYASSPLKFRRGKNTMVNNCCGSKLELFRCSKWFLLMKSLKHFSSKQLHTRHCTPSGPQQNTWRSLMLPPGGWTHIVDPEEAKCHHMSTPFGPGSTGTAAGGDAAAIKHDRNVVGSLWLTRLTGHNCSTEMEPWWGKHGRKNGIRQVKRKKTHYQKH